MTALTKTKQLFLGYEDQFQDVQYIHNVKHETGTSSLRSSNPRGTWDWQGVLDSGHWFDIKLFCPNMVHVSAPSSLTSYLFLYIFTTKLKIFGIVPLIKATTRTINTSPLFAIRLPASRDVIATFLEAFSTPTAQALTYVETVG